MEKVMKARLAVVALCLVLLLAAAGPEAADATDYLSYNGISCKALGNCDKNLGPDATRPGKPANTYTRGCSAINKCRG